MRLAEKRGVLQGRISRVQEYVIHLLRLADAREKSQEKLDDLKFALISFDPVKFIPTMFPDWEKKKEENKVRVEATEKDLKDTKGEWEMSKDITPMDAEEIMAQLLGSPVGTITGKDAGMDDDGWM